MHFEVNFHKITSWIEVNHGLFGYYRYNDKDWLMSRKIGVPEITVWTLTHSRWPGVGYKILAIWKIQKSLGNLTNFGPPKMWDMPKISQPGV